MEPVWDQQRPEAREFLQSGPFSFLRLSGGVIDDLSERMSVKDRRLSVKQEGRRALVTDLSPGAVNQDAATWRDNQPPPPTPPPLPPIMVPVHSLRSRWKYNNANVITCIYIEDLKNLRRFKSLKSKTSIRKSCNFHFYPPDLYWRWSLNHSGFWLTALKPTGPKLNIWDESPLR